MKAAERREHQRSKIKYRISNIGEKHQQWRKLAVAMHGISVMAYGSNISEIKGIEYGASKHMKMAAAGERRQMAASWREIAEACR